MRRVGRARICYNGRCLGTHLRLDRRRCGRRQSRQSLALERGLKPRRHRAIRRQLIHPQGVNPRRHIRQRRSPSAIRPHNDICDRGTVQIDPQARASTRAPAQHHRAVGSVADTLDRNISRQLGRHFGSRLQHLHPLGRDQHRRRSLQRRLNATCHGDFRSTNNRGQRHSLGSLYGRAIRARRLQCQQPRDRARWQIKQRCKLALRIGHSRCNLNAIDQHHHRSPRSSLPRHRRSPIGRDAGDIKAGQNRPRQCRSWRHNRSNGRSLCHRSGFPYRDLGRCIRRGFSAWGFGRRRCGSFTLSARRRSDGCSIACDRRRISRPACGCLSWHHGHGRAHKTEIARHRHHRSTAQQHSPPCRRTQSTPTSHRFPPIRACSRPFFLLSWNRYIKR